MNMKHELKFKSFSTLSDDELLRRLSELLQKSRRVESELVAHIGEVDARRLYAREAAPSMFAYCTDVLKLSEHEAYLRIAVARASRAHPVLLEMLAEGRLPLSVIARLAPHLTEANRETVLAQAEGKTKRQIEELVAELAPKPDVPATMRKLPEGGDVATRSETSNLSTHSAAGSVHGSCPAAGRGASRSSTLQDPVHRQRRVPRHAGATPLADALVSS